MLKTFFDSKPVAEFASRVMREAIQIIPPPVVAGGGKKAERQQARLDAWLSAQIVQLVSQQRWSFYQKAKLGTCLEEALSEAGYPESFSRTLSRHIVSLIAATRPQAV